MSFDAVCLAKCFRVTSPSRQFWLVISKVFIADEAVAPFYIKYVDLAMGVYVGREISVKMG
jgi:hypothetical protein